jgi:hypothetical protein
MLSLFPTLMSTRYLFLVSMMANVFKDDERAAKLGACDNARQLHKLLSEYTQAYIGQSSEHAIISGADEDHNLSGRTSTDLELLIRLDRLYAIAAEGKAPEMKG